jgi:predicted TIM-barrel fold metal-dependent hydrolase
LRSGPMVIDCHVHCKGGDLYRREFSADQILRTMDEAEIDRSIVFAICLPSVESQEMTQAICAAAPDRLTPFAHVLPDEGPLALVELERAITQLGFRGLKLHLGELPGDLRPAEIVAMLEPLVQKCGDLNCPCLIDAKGLAEVIDQLAETGPKSHLIVAHLGCSQGEAAIDRFIGLAATRHNVFLDTAYVHQPWKIGDAIGRAGAGKVIFGSDGPLIHPAIERRKLEVLHLDTEQWEAVTSRNILALLDETEAVAPVSRRSCPRLWKASRIP